MARRYYRSRVRYIKPKKKWATNIVSEYMTIPQSTGVSFSRVAALVTNSTQGNSPTPVILKCGNFKCSVDAWYRIVGPDPSTVAMPAVSAYIVFVPQGFFPTNVSEATSAQVASLLADHPEYIMAWRMIDTAPVSNGNQESFAVTFSSRLKRNLNSGDRVCMILRATSDISTTFSLQSSYTCQYWTCAN